MNNIIKGIASTMIIVLIILLIWIFLEYYRNSTFVDTLAFPSGNTHTSTLIPSGDYISEDKKNIEDGLIESIIGQKDPIKEVEMTSGEAVIKNNEAPDIVIEIPSSKIEESNPSEQIMISSNTETSNQQKQEILSEIDEALQGLLEAVGKVETVDETRLEATLDREVDKP